MLIAIIGSFFTAIFSVVFSCILTEPGMILEWYRIMIDKLPLPIYKALGGCAVCFSGQLAFWYYLMYGIDNWNYSIEGHIIIVILSIFLTDILQKTYYR